MKYKLTEKDNEWVKTCISKDFTRLQVKRKLDSANYPIDRIESFLNYYDELQDKIKSQEPIKERNVEEEREFKNNVKKYFSENKNELSRKEKKEVNTFLKNIDRYSKTLKLATKNFKKEIQLFYEKGWNPKKIEKEGQFLKRSIIDSLLDSTDLLEITNPITKEEINKENLMLLNIQQLIELMEENNEELELIVNGKIDENDETN